MEYRNLSPDRDRELAELIRRNLKARKLDIPGTAYFDENLYHLSDFYSQEPDKRVYRILGIQENTAALYALPILCVVLTIVISVFFVGVREAVSRMMRPGLT